MDRSDQSIFRSTVTLSSFGTFGSYRWPRTHSPIINRVLKGRRFLTLNTVVGFHQIEVTRDKAHGPDESSIHTVNEARTFRETIERKLGQVDGSLGPLVGLRSTTNARSNRELRDQIVAYHRQYGDEVTFILGPTFRTCITRATK